jgi:hypothetical protein
VLYAESEQRALIEDAIRTWLTQGAPEPAYCADLLYFYASCFKAPYFEEEKEWRIIRDLTLGSAPELAFTIRGDGFLPYIEIGPTPGADPLALPITSIWFAWSLPEARTQHVIRDMLYARGKTLTNDPAGNPYANVPVNRSPIQLEPSR